MPTQFNSHEQAVLIAERRNNKLQARAEAVKKLTEIQAAFMPHVQNLPHITVEIRPSNDEQKVIVILRSKRVDSQFWGPTFFLQAWPRRFSDLDYEHFILMFPRVSGRRKRKYTKLEEKTYKKIAKMLAETEEEAYNAMLQTNAQQDISEQWQELRNKTLAGVIIPPGFAVGIWEDGTEAPNADTVPTFCMSCSRHGHFNLDKYKLTAEQVIKIATVISETLELDKAWVIVAHKQPIDEEKEAYAVVWDGSWFETLSTKRKGRPYLTKEAAEAELKRIPATTYGHLITNPQVVPFSSIF